MRAFRLGQLAEAEVAAIEETAFDDPASFEELRTVEDELFEAYLDGGLLLPMRPRTGAFCRRPRAGPSS